MNSSPRTAVSGCHHCLPGSTECTTEQRRTTGRRGYDNQGESQRSQPTPQELLELPGLNGQLAYSDATIEHLAVQDPRLLRLRSIPSIGPVTAAAFLAAIDHAKRFRHAHQLEAYLGLVPGEYSSGETQRRGAITKAGHSRPRWLLIQAAVSILRRRPPQAEALRTWALRIAARRGKHVAVVALARRLAGILYALLRDGSVFEPQRVRSSAPSRGWSRRLREHVNHLRRRPDRCGPWSLTGSMSG